MQGLDILDRIIAQIIRIVTVYTKDEEANDYVDEAANANSYSLITSWTFNKPAYESSRSLWCSWPALGWSGDRIHSRFNGRVRNGIEHQKLANNMHNSESWMKHKLIFSNQRMVSFSRKVSK